MRSDALNLIQSYQILQTDVSLQDLKKKKYFTTPLPMGVVNLLLTKLHSVWFVDFQSFNKNIKSEESCITVKLNVD